MTAGVGTGPALPDRIAPIGPAGVHLTGYLGERVAANDAHLGLVDLEPLLAGFRQRPGSHPWIGEHIGKWLHAASLTYERTRDPALGSRLEHAATALLATQAPDGYLGTYPADRRFGRFEGADWDVWVHTYVLIGLLAYHDATGDRPALEGAVRVGDLLDRTFRAGPKPRRIVDAGTHVGMAATSVLEPVVGLFERTGEPRYLAFAQSIVDAWDLPGGPHVLSTLRDTGRVREIGNGKAYELLSNLVGLVDLARVTGDASILAAVARGWDDVATNHRYLTGGASFAEHFGRDGERPGAMAINVAETCVTVTWLQLTGRLLRLAGDARYADDLERTAYNALLAAQHPDGRTWCYYTPLAGWKPFGPGISCCVSSGPRGVAMLPSLVYGRTPDNTLAVTLFESSSTAGVTQVSNVPSAGGAKLELAHPMPSGVLVRQPTWATRIAGPGITARTDGWLAVDVPADGRIALAFDMAPRRIEGDGSDRGRVAEAYGPLVLAYPIAVEGRDRRTPAFDVVRGDERVLSPSEDPGPAVVIERRLSNPVDGIDDVAVRWLPMAEVGVDGAPYRVWFAEAPVGGPVSLLVGGVESRAAGTIPHGSAMDGEPYSFATSFDGTDHGEDWFAVTVAAPVRVGRIVVGHGWSWVNGGWFDASSMRPVVEVRTDANGPWIAIGEVPGYPSTTASSPAGLRGGERFTIALPEPLDIVAVRVRGRGSYGEYPPGRYATCGELAAYAS